MAQYEYGPFGELLRATGPMAKANPFRFSNKFQDDETDLVYYGYRYYSPGAGRWLSRDPIEEEGGLNLYAFVGNTGVSSFDALGQKTETIGVLGAKWKFKPKHVSAPPKEDRGPFTGTTEVGTFPRDVYITEKGCEPGKKQLRAHDTTYTLKYWYINHAAKVYEEQNVEEVRGDWGKYCGAVDSLGGCFCDSCATIRLDLTQLYQAFYYAWAARAVVWRDIDIMHIDRWAQYQAFSQAIQTLQPEIDAKRLQLTKCVLDSK